MEKMQRRAVATAAALSRVRNDCQKVAGYGETTSVGAWVVGPTRDGRLARMGLAVVYEFRGHDAHAASSAEEHSQYRLKRQGLGRAAFFAPPSAHTWWPEQIHLCAALVSVCGQAATDALAELDVAAMVADAESTQRVGGVVHAHARAHMRDWGALPLTTITRAQPLDAAESLSTPRPSPCWFSTITSTESHPWETVQGLPSTDAPLDELSDFFDHAVFRSAALRRATSTGHHPYSYGGMQVMFRDLVEFESVAARHGRATDPFKSMRLQLYGARHRIGAH